MLAGNRLAQKLILSPVGGFISFPFRCCRHLRFPVTSTNFNLSFWFPLGCSSFYAFASWQFFLVTHPAVSSVFVFWCLPFIFPLCMAHAHFHFTFYNPFCSKCLLPCNFLLLIQSHLSLKRNKRTKKDAFLAAIP